MCPSGGASSTTNGSGVTAIWNGADSSASASCPGTSWHSTAKPRTCYGVATGGSSFAFWQVDPVGISLWIDFPNGGGAVRLGERTLEAATVRVRRGNKGETAFESAHRFCRVLCDQPRLAPAPVYGGNYVKPMIIWSPQLSPRA